MILELSRFQLDRKYKSGVESDTEARPHGKAGRPSQAKRQQTRSNVTISVATVSRRVSALLDSARLDERTRNRVDHLPRPIRTFAAKPAS